MPIYKSLHKVSKKLSKQSSGSLHVKGRKFKQLNRATERDSKLKLKKLRFAEQKNHELLFYLHIQKSISDLPQDTKFTMEDMRQILEAHIGRDDEEIAEMEKERRPGRPMTNKHQIKIEKRKHEQHLFETGFKFPDLRDVETAQRVRNWNGTSGAVSGWKWTLITKEASQPTKENEDETMN